MFIKRPNRMVLNAIKNNTKNYGSYKILFMLSVYKKESAITDSFNMPW